MCVSRQSDELEDTEHFCPKCGQSWGVHNGDGSCIIDEDVDTFRQDADDGMFVDPEDDLNYDIYDADEDERD